MNPSSSIIYTSEIEQLRQQLAEANRKIEYEQLCASELEQQLATLRELKQAWHDKFWTQCKETNELRQQLAETTDLLNHARRSMKQSAVNGDSESAAWNEGVEAAQSGKKKSDCPYPYESEEWDYWIDGFRDVMWQKENFPDTETKEQ